MSEPPPREPFDDILREGVDERNLERAEKSPDERKAVPPLKGDLYVKGNLGLDSISNEQLNQEIRCGPRPTHSYRSDIRWI